MVRPSSGMRSAVLALLFFSAALCSRPMFQQLDAPYGTLVWKVFWVVACFAGVCVAHGLRTGNSATELGLRGSIPFGLGFGLLSSLPMFLAYAANEPMKWTLSGETVLMTEPGGSGVRVPSNSSIVTA